MSSSVQPPPDQSGRRGAPIPGTIYRILREAGTPAGNLDGAVDAIIEAVAVPLVAERDAARTEARRAAGGRRRRDPVADMRAQRDRARVQLDAALAELDAALAELARRGGDR